ncbi:MAG: acyloxyacyl hydrolase [Candidatus Omnitrophota bacterium]|nr:MAG: acyloxyacyl hydrolase [Candidatus Omnitrophota bacterium]
MKGILQCLTAVFFLVVCVDAYCLDGIEIFTGYMNANLDEQDDYEGIPLFVAFNFDGKPLLSDIGIEFPGRFDFVIEPFVNTMFSPDPNVEVGSNFLIKYVLPLTETVQPYVKGGLGALYMSQHTREQSTQYNFLPQGGAGVHIFLNENTAMSFEYRYRHLSNNSFKSPNSGINTDLFLGGISFFFD